jgi:adenylate kinase
MRMVFVGPPGCGKGTQAKLLKERLGFTVIGTGDIFRAAIAANGPIGLRVKPFLESGRLVPDDLVNEVVADYFRRDDRPTKFIMDGYPRTLPQATSFDAVLRQCFLDLSAAVHFVLPDDEVIRRLSGRRQIEARADDDDATVRKRLEVYRANTEPLIDHYRRHGLLREIDAGGDVETVYQRIVALIPE